MTPDAPVIISTDGALRAFCGRMKTHPFLAVDTEFMRVSTYWPHLCLIQVSTGDETVIIDPLSGDFGLDPFFDLMRDPKIIKVFHSGRQDLEIFWRLMGDVPAPIFDTQIAAMALGPTPSISFDKLIEQFLGKTLDKSAQRSLWDVRPLTNNQIAYAAEDARALAAVYGVMLDLLTRQNRLSWIASENAALTDVRLYKPNPQTVFRRIRLPDGSPLIWARLQFLAAIREKAAMDRNLPRGHLLKDEFLIDLAKTNPDSLKSIKEMESCPRVRDDDLMERLLGGLGVVSDLDPSFYPTPPARTMPKEDEKRACKKIQEIFIDVSQSHQLCPRLLGTTNDIMDWIQAFKTGNTALDCMTDWRKDIIGDRVLTVLQALVPAAL